MKNREKLIINIKDLINELKDKKSKLKKNVVEKIENK